jgi:alpha-L-arabinofuranosidase
MNRQIIIFAAIVLFFSGIMACTQTIRTTLIVDVSRPGVKVAPICRGQQLEEFNHQIQGGLYAQLINNPSFEEIDDKFKNNPSANWTLILKGSSDGKFIPCTSFQTAMLNNKQQHCINLLVNSVASGNVGLANGGYWGIKLENKTTYQVSFWAKKGSNFSGTIKAKLESNDGVVYAQSADFKPTTSWQHFKCDLITSGISNVTGTNRFVLYASSTGDLYFDVVTLMPPTWKNRPNGLRPDLAERLDALKLKYIQYPGGCDSESGKLDVYRDWKNSIGPIEERSGSMRPIWGYKNDLYFGLDEFFQMCEDLGAEPIYTVPSGISESPHWPQWHVVCPLDQMQPIIDNILDLLEYCNGSASTTWGCKRAQNGHPAPYNLKYIEIGNENFIFQQTAYLERYPLIYNAVHAAYPDIKVIMNGACDYKVSHTYGNSADFVDDHFGGNKEASDTGYNQYNSIDPDCKKIVACEYGSAIHGHTNNEIATFEDAIADAIVSLGMEKNSARTWYSGYANYGTVTGHCSYGSCLVVSNSLTSYGIPSYYMQKMLFSDNLGSRILPFTQNSANCYWSASVDTELGKNDILLKAVNNKNRSESVNITLKGVVKVHTEGHSTTLTGAPDDENSLTNPTKVVPSTGTFNAADNFKYNFPTYSITVLRIRVLK